MGHGKYIDPFDGQRRSWTKLFRPFSGEKVLVHGGNPARHIVEAGQKLELEFCVMPGESGDIDIEVDLVGEGASVEIKGLYLLGGSEIVRICTLVHHRVPGCHSSQLINGIASGQADVRFDGVIVVAPDAQHTEAFQENHNIVLSADARVETLPQLEIYADDVKCSHGATVGQLDEDALFYMRSRGVPEKEARVLQMLSFLSGVIPAGREEEVENAVRNL